MVYYVSLSSYSFSGLAMTFRQVAVNANYDDHIMTLESNIFSSIEGKRTCFKFIHITIKITPFGLMIMVSDIIVSNCLVSEAPGTMVVARNALGQTQVEKAKQKGSAFLCVPIKSLEIQRTEYATQVSSRKGIQRFTKLNCFSKMSD